MDDAPECLCRSPPDHRVRSVRQAEVSRTSTPSGVVRPLLEQLLAEGYVPIGALTIIRVTSICYETCKLIEHQNGATATLLAAAGKRGGDLVVLQKDDVETTRDVMKQGQCLESYIEDRTVDVYISPVGGAGNRYEPVHRSAEVCTKFQMLHGHETFQQSSGVVWRRE
jgi:hypothetical protein